MCCNVCQSYMRCLEGLIQEYVLQCLPVLYEMFRRADTGVCVVMFVRCLEGLIQEDVL